MATLNELQTSVGTLAAPQQSRQFPVVRDDSQFGSLLDTAKFEHLQRVAKMFSESSLVPEQFQKNPANCFIAMQMALRLKVDPLMFMQSCYVVHGKPGIEAKLAIALANASGVFSDRISYRMEGDGASRQCTAVAHDSATGDKLEITVSMGMAKAEGWIDKAGSKWKTIPELMLRYRAAMFLIRVYAPEAILGLQSSEELEDIDGQQSYPSTPRASRVIRSSLTQQLLPPSESQTDCEQKSDADAVSIQQREFLDRAAGEISSCASADALEAWAVRNDREMSGLAPEDGAWITDIYEARRQTLLHGGIRPAGKQGRLIEDDGHGS